MLSRQSSQLSRISSSFCSTLAGASLPPDSTTYHQGERCKSGKPLEIEQQFPDDGTLMMMMEFQQFPASENLWKSNKNFLTTNHPALKGFCTNDTAWSQVGMSSLYWVSAWCLFGLPQWCLKPEASWHEHLSFCLVTRVVQARTNCFYIIWSKLAVALLHGIWSCDARYCQTHFSCPNSALAD